MMFHVERFRVLLGFTGSFLTANLRWFVDGCGAFVDDVVSSKLDICCQEKGPPVWRGFLFVVERYS